MKIVLSIVLALAGALSLAGAGEPTPAAVIVDRMVPSAKTAAPAAPIPATSKRQQQRGGDNTGPMTPEWKRTRESGSISGGHSGFPLNRWK
jgi:hypothetical protein